MASIWFNGKEIKVDGPSSVYVSGGRIVVNGVDRSSDFGESIEVLRVVVDGSPVSVDSHAPVTVNGDVGGNVYAGTSVTCDNVKGSVTAGAYVTCDDVRGNVSAGSYVTCDDVAGSVTAGGKVNRK